MVKPARSSLIKPNYRIVYKDGTYRPQKKCWYGWLSLYEEWGNGSIHFDFRKENDAIRVIIKDTEKQKRKKIGPKIREFYYSAFGLQDLNTREVINYPEHKNHHRPHPAPTKSKPKD